MQLRLTWNALSIPVLKLIIFTIQPAIISGICHHLLISLAVLFSLVLFFSAILVSQVVFGDFMVGWLVGSFLRQDSLHSLGCPEMHYEKLAGLKLT